MRKTISLKMDMEAGEIVGWEKFWEVLDKDGLSEETKNQIKNRIPKKLDQSKDYSNVNKQSALIENDKEQPETKIESNH